MMVPLPTGVAEGMPPMGVAEGTEPGDGFGMLTAPLDRPSCTREEEVSSPLLRSLEERRSPEDRRAHVGLPTIVTGMTESSPSSRRVCVVE